jgi:hypothetical protein
MVKFIGKREHSFPDWFQESFVEKTTDPIRNAAQTTTNYVQNAIENTTEASGNLVNRTQDATQNLVNQATNNDNENEKGK